MKCLHKCVIISQLNRIYAITYIFHSNYTQALFPTLASMNCFIRLALSKTH